LRIFDALLVLAEATVARGGRRRICEAFVPEPCPDPARNAEFGVLELDDGCAGLYYAWMGATQAGMAARFPSAALIGCDALDIARQYPAGDDAVRALALAAVNALTASAWRLADYQPPAAISSFGVVPDTRDRLGLIGNFPSLVRQATAAGLEVIVVERKPHMVRSDAGVTVTLDPRALAACTRIVCTAATLVNDSLDEMLGYCPAGAEIAVVGPTAGSYPEPLFARGVTTVGGTLVLDATVARHRLAAGEKLGDAARRYALSPATYPGTAALLARGK